MLNKRGRVNKEGEKEGARKGERNSEQTSAAATAAAAFLTWRKPRPERRRGRERIGPSPTPPASRHVPVSRHPQSPREDLDARQRELEPKKKPTLLITVPLGIATLWLSSVIART